jgi:hypothetical protein
VHLTVIITVSTVLKKLPPSSFFSYQAGFTLFLNIWRLFRGQNQKKLTPSNGENNILPLQRNVPQPINSMPVFAETLKFKQQTLGETVTSECLHSFCSLSYDRSIDSCKAGFPNNVI